MDSSNSGSVQSSSGGADNDEYDARTQSISSFFNPSTTFNPNLNQLLQPPPPSYHRPSPTHNNFFNPSSTHPFSPLQDPASAWTGTIRADRNLAEFGTYPINPNPNPSTMDTHTKPGRGSDHQIGVTVKNPKKRTRASRRAPTTVLTTDTTNFRQMVQEFTGIPTAPFTAAPFSRRVDLFGRATDVSTGSLHPLRPSAQKIQPPPPPFLSSTSHNTTTATTSGSYQVPPCNINEFQKQPSTFLDLQNPMFSFQSLLQNSIPQQSSELQNSSKSWGDQNGKMENFEGVIGNSESIGGSKLNSGVESVLVSSRSGGDAVEGSWICPSN